MLVLEIKIYLHSIQCQIEILCISSCSIVVFFFSISLIIFIFLSSFPTFAMHQSRTTFENSFLFYIFNIDTIKLFCFTYPSSVKNFVVYKLEL